MPIALRCSTQARAGTFSTDGRQWTDCPQCGCIQAPLAAVVSHTGKRQRMYVFERAYKDFCGQVSRVLSSSEGLLHLKIWNWFLALRRAGDRYRAARSLVVLSGVWMGYLYVNYEGSKPATPNSATETIFAFVLITGYVILLLWGFKTPVSLSACSPAAVPPVPSCSWACSCCSSAQRSFHYLAGLLLLDPPAADLKMMRIALDST